MSSNPLPPTAAIGGTPYGASTAPPPATNPRNSVLFGPNGLRAGWRIAIFIVLFILFGQGLNFVLHHIPSVVAWHKAVGNNAMTPTLLLFDEGTAVAILLAIVFIMSLIEKRTFADYYLPPNEAFGKRFWQGVPYGFAMLSALMGLIAAFHGFSIQGFAVGGAVALKFGLMYFVGFILVGMLEEFLMRGYLQSTLGSGIGFWWAAVILSTLFGLAHIQNASEDWFGAVMAGSFGLLAAFALYRTGNIWFPLGMHAAWDWGETYFYGVPDSGFKPVGNLLNSTLSGPHWIAGGVVGPEGSAFAILVLALGAVGIHFLFPRKQVND
jgi:uncharacterized protein